MAHAFVVMQIGNAELDRFYEEAIVPAVRAAGLAPKRVDRDNEGKALTGEIARFIREADIVIADLTNDRPNCYLGVGFTMGLGKYANLILSARDDHFHDSANYNVSGPRLHFDIGGYDILRWNLGGLEEYRQNLTRMIKHRLEVVNRLSHSSDSSASDLQDWFLGHTGRARPASVAAGFDAGMEIFLSVDGPSTLRDLKTLNNACKEAPISQFGRRVGLYVRHPPEHAPQPRVDGIIAEIKQNEGYDYWAARIDGSFYQDLSLLEESQEQRVLFLDYQIMRATETLLFAERFYTHLGYKPDDSILVQLQMWGLKDRHLSALSKSAAFTLSHRVCTETDSSGACRTQIGDIETKLFQLVRSLCDPTLLLFQFFQPHDNVYKQNIDKLRHELNL